MPIKNIKSLSPIKTATGILILKQAIIKIRHHSVRAAVSLPL
jgi:hypothetical protein